MAKGENYEEFVEKFKPKKTTDDCYTPQLVYDAVAEWVAKEYGLNPENFVRPFYPGGDYEHFDYDSKIVVDNPPFSILSKIIDFYILHGVQFFLFAPSLLLFSVLRNRDCTALIVDNDVTYANGAVVKTSFITNLEPKDLRFRTCPTLYTAVKNACDKIRTEAKKKLPKYSFPPFVAQSARLKPYSRYGIEYRVKKSESVFISRLDSQIESKKAIFGGGYLVSERCAAEREKAEREKAEREKAEIWELSDREKEIVKNLGREKK